MQTYRQKQTNVSDRRKDERIEIDIKSSLKYLG